MANSRGSLLSPVPVRRPARTSCAMVAAVTPMAAPATGCRDKQLHVSDDTRTRIDKVLTTIQTDVRESCASGLDSDAFTEVVASTQKDLREIRGDNKTAAEYAAVLLAAQILFHEKGHCDG